MGLLRADLQALGNLPTTAVGRRVITSIGLGLFLFALSSWWFAAAVFEQPQLLELLHGQSGGDSLRGLIGHGLMPCPMAATWLGIALAQRQLFETPELQLWRSSPLPSWRGALQILLRACFLTLFCARRRTTSGRRALHWSSPTRRAASIRQAGIGSTRRLIFDPTLRMPLLLSMTLRSA